MLCLTLLIVLFESVVVWGQLQLGNDIDGEAAIDLSGQSVSLDGNRLAIGAFLNDASGNDAGHARIYEWDGTTWTQLGADIDGEATFDFSGISVSLDGNLVAIGGVDNDGNGSNAGHVRVYEWDGANWVQLGADIDGEAAEDRSGWSVVLDSTRLAISAYKNDGNGNNAGHVRVYEWNGSSWVQLGADIDGEAPNDAFGQAVALEGNRLAVCASFNDDAGRNAGHTRVYEWDGANWVQLGADIDGEAAGDSGKSVVLDGNRVAAGAPFNDGNGNNAGRVRVHEWNGSNWTQLGADIDGEASNDLMGLTMALAGNTLVVGAPYNDGNGSNAGQVRIYQWDGTSWIQIGPDIDGEAAGDEFGTSVSLDGSRLAVGAPYNDGNGNDAGHVRVYDLSAILSTVQQIALEEQMSIKI